MISLSILNWTCAEPRQGRLWWVHAMRRMQLVLTRSHPETRSNPQGRQGGWTKRQRLETETETGTGTGTGTVTVTGTEAEAEIETETETETMTEKKTETEKETEEETEMGRSRERESARAREKGGRGETFLTRAFDNTIYLILDNKVWRLVHFRQRISSHDFAVRRRPDRVPLLPLLRHRPWLAAAVAPWHTWPRLEPECEMSPDGNRWHEGWWRLWCRTVSWSG